MAENLFEGRNCECCGKPDYLVGVASSALGAFSILWCQLCIKMNADPKWSIDALYEMKDWRIIQAKKDDFVYFDPELDNYVRYGSKEIVPFELNDGTKFENRSQLVEWLKQQEEGD